jgi:hypothetical protein
MTWSPRVCRAKPSTHPRVPPARRNAAQSEHRFPTGKSTAVQADCTLICNLAKGQAHRPARREDVAACRTYTKLIFALLTLPIAALIQPRAAEAAPYWRWCAASSRCNFCTYGTLQCSPHRQQPLPSRQPTVYTFPTGAVSDARSVVMDVDVVVSAWLGNISTCIAAALFAVVCVEPRTASAAECGANCDLDVRTSQYGDPRCRPREVVPKTSSVPFPAFEGEGPRCDLRRPRLVRHHAPSVKPQTPSPAPLAKQVPSTGANQPSTGTSDAVQQPRTVDRDVGFSDAFGTRADESRAASRAPAGAGGLGAGNAGGVGVGNAGGVGLGNAGGLGLGNAGGLGAGGAARGRP